MNGVPFIIWVMWVTLLVLGYGGAAACAWMGVDLWRERPRDALKWMGILVIWTCALLCLAIAIGVTVNMYPPTWKGHL